MAIGHYPLGAMILVAVKFNLDMEAPDGNLQDEEITVAMVGLCLEDMSVYFLLCHKYCERYGSTWIMHCIGR